jgi:hypothetical protein
LQNFAGCRTSLQAASLIRDELGNYQGTFSKRFANQFICTHNSVNNQGIASPLQPHKNYNVFPNWLVNDGHAQHFSSTSLSPLRAHLSNAQFASPQLTHHQSSAVIGNSNFLHCNIMFQFTYTTRFNAPLPEPFFTFVTLP